MFLHRHAAQILSAFICFFVLSALQTPACAADDGPGSFVTRLGEKTIEKLTDVSLTPAARETEFRNLLREGFAIGAIAKFVLGKYGAEASSEKVDEFGQVFEDYIVSLYGKQYSADGKHRFEVEKVAATSRPKDSMVMTRIVSGDGSDPLRVNFQVRDLGDSFKILDVRVEGVSMVLAQREEFTAYIAANGGEVDSLVAALRKRIADNDAKSAKN
jgi:phospholipid transport system substrate-binding protein